MTEKQHSRLSASGSHIWLNCSGSVKLSEQAPPKTTHPSAVVGTVAHLVCEAALDYALGKVEHPHENMLGEEIQGVMVDREMLKAAELYVDFISQIFDPKTDQISIEERVELPDIHPDMFGTADCIIKKPNGSIHVVDFKYGAYPVMAKNNSQMIYYALGAMATSQSTPPFCSINIVQPRTSDGKPTKSWLFKSDEFDTWINKFKTAAQSADIGTPLNKGKWCMFCQAKPICKLHNKTA